MNKINLIFTGTYKDYHFLQTAEDGYDFKRFIKEFEELVAGKSIAILSYDGDALKPTKEEFNRGWKYDDKEIAYFDNINSQELKTEIFANCYDEWYLFEKPTNLKTNYTYVTHTGFRLINDNNDTLMANLISRFWNDIEINNPMSFIIYGDNFIYGSKNKDEINNLKTAWR